MKTNTLALIALLSLAAFPVVVANHSDEGSYTVASTPGLSIVCAPDCLGTGLGLNIGGYTFDPTGEVPGSVVVADVGNGDVAFTVCQDLNGALCGEAGEPRVVVCGKTADLSKSLVPFRAGVATSVFVRSVDNACAGQASSGTITLNYL